MCLAVMLGSELALSKRPWPMWSYSLLARSAVAERSSPDPDPPPTPGMLSKCHSSGSTCSTICLGFLSYTRSTRSACGDQGTSVSKHKHWVLFQGFPDTIPATQIHCTKLVCQQNKQNQRTHNWFTDKISKINSHTAALLSKQLGSPHTLIGLLQDQFTLLVYGQNNQDQHAPFAYHQNNRKELRLHTTQQLAHYQLTDRTIRMHSHTTAPMRRQSGSTLTLHWFTTGSTHASGFRTE